MRLNDVLDLARRRGLATPPLFLSVTLVRRVAQALAEHHATPRDGPSGEARRELLASVRPHGEALEAERASASAAQAQERASDHALASARPAAPRDALDLSLDVDGTVRVLTSTDPHADVAAAALLLDRLMGEELDGELTRVIHAARRAEQPLRPDELEHRLGHWLVKQRQLFTGLDLVAELRAWLVSDTARPCDAQVATWLESACLVTARPAPIPRAAVSRLGKVVFGLAFLVMTLIGLLLLHAHEEREVFAPNDPEPIRLPPPPPVPTPPPLKLGGARYVPEADLPRWLSGPQRATLSSDVHGIDLTRAGIPLDLPGPVRWGLKVKVAPGQRLDYAALFVASLDHGALGGVGVVGARDWKWLDGSAARAFAVQPDLAPDEGSFGLLVARQFPDGRIEEVPALARAQVFGEAMAQQEGRRLVVDSLDPGVTYDVTLERTAVPLFVVATATTRRGDGRTMRGDGFQAKGHPLDQVLLQPGVPIKVRQVRRLSFVVLALPGQPEARAQVEIVRAATAPPRAPEPPAAGDSEAQWLLKEGLRELAHGRPDSAAQLLRQCLKVAPRNVDCEVNLQRALTGAP